MQDNKFYWLKEVIDSSSICQLYPPFASKSLARDNICLTPKFNTLENAVECFLIDAHKDTILSYNTLT